jgi:DNA-binding NarL/FixJ family response regulator
VTEPTAENAIEIVVVDDHPVVRSGLRTMLAAAGIRVVGEAGDGREAINVVITEQPDVVLMDLAMPGMGGIEATRRIVADAPHVAVLVVSMSGDDESVFAALRAGARGYVLKGSDPADVVRAVESVASGGTVFGPGLADRVLGFFTRPPPPDQVPFPELTDRERDVLALLGKGLSNAAISARLGIQAKTVRNHVSNVLTKLAAADRTDAVLRAREAGLT